MKFSATFSIVLHVCAAYGLYKLFLEHYSIIWNHVNTAKLVWNSTKFEVLNQPRNENLNLQRQNSPTPLPILRSGSSAWCFGSTKSERICKFRNLCYHPVYNEYIFFHGPETILNGVPQNRFDPALLEMSSVEDHNIQYFNFVDLPRSSLDNFENISLLEGTSLIFHRFMPDNIMHVIHDDLLPLYHTMREFSFSNTSIDLDLRLVLMEDWDPGTYFHLYKLFTNKIPLLKKDLRQNNSMTCFENAIVGISKFTTWYQYGFSSPQGPLTGIKLRGQDIFQFTKFVKEKLGLNNLSLMKQIKDPYIVLVSRSHNRLILNELELAMTIATQFNLRVVRVSMETHSFKEQVEVISKAKGLVGMHGSILIMSMFLPPGAVVIELFPYAINPKNYTPYKTLLELPGMSIVYSAWQNVHEEKTVTHPDDPPDIGGIAHLSIEEQEAIKATKEIPRHRCCNNPHWLYRIYQDTTVDTKSFLQVMDASLKQSKKLEVNTNSSADQLLFPSKVLNVTCHDTSQQPALWLSWDAPWNVKMFRSGDLKYEVWIQKEGQKDYKAYILNFTEHVFTDSLKGNSQYHVWVRCIVDNKVGPFGSVKECRTY